MRFRRLILLAPAMVLSSPALAGSRAADSSAVVVTRLSFISHEDLEFGGILPGTTAGTVTVSPAGARSSTGGVTLSGGTVQAARFSGYGFPNQLVAISVNATPQTMARVGGGATMTYGVFTIGSTPTAVITTAPLNFRISSATGFFSFPLGARLNVAANQMPGNYRDSFTITLNYQ